MLLNILLIAVALSFDSMAVGAANGASHHRMSIKKSLEISLSFGFFQALMPFLGWIIGGGFQKIIADYDHWVAFILLAILGIKMILESIKDTEEKSTDIHNFKVLILLSVATSIDALVVGISFAFLPIKIWEAVPIIGIVTFILTLFSIHFGKKCGEYWGKKAEVIGGIILILIGLKILIFP